MRFSVRLFICFLLLAAVLLAEKFTNADTALQNLFYRPETHEWLINPALHQKLSPVFYKGLKFLLAATGAGCLIFLLLSLKKPSLAVRRRPVPNILLTSTVLTSSTYTTAFTRLSALSTAIRKVSCNPNPDAVFPPDTPQPVSPL